MVEIIMRKVEKDPHKFLKYKTKRKILSNEMK